MGTLCLHLMQLSLQQLDSCYSLDAYLCFQLPTLNTLLGSALGGDIFRAILPVSQA